MTNWQKFRITNRKVEPGILLYIKTDVSLAGYDPLVFADRPPFNTWQVGDYIEIDVDNIYNK